MFRLRWLLPPPRLSPRSSWTCTSCTQLWDESKGWWWSFTNSPGGLWQHHRVLCTVLILFPKKPVKMVGTRRTVLSVRVSLEARWDHMSWWGEVVTFPPSLYWSQTVLRYALKLLLVQLGGFWMNRWVRLFGIVVTGLTPKQKIDVYFFFKFYFSLLPFVCAGSCRAGDHSWEFLDTCRRKM